MTRDSRSIAAASRGCVIAAAMTITIAVAAGRTLAQDDPQFATWSKVESSEAAKKYLDGIRKGEFDDSSQAFLERVALPQLAADGNRRQIERVRRRMRDVLLDEKKSEPGALARAAGVAVDWLAAQARSPAADPVVRVNAMLLLGEIRGKDGKPWSGCLPPLSAAVGSQDLPTGVRVAAAAGLARHVAAARAAGGPDAAVGDTVMPALLAVLSGTAAPADHAARDWLVSRAVDMLPAVAAKPPPEVHAALMAILGDLERSVDVRVRAAAALGATMTPDLEADAARGVTAIVALAVEALRGDVAVATARTLARRVAGGQGPAGSMGPGEGPRGPGRMPFQGPSGPPGMNSPDGMSARPEDEPIDALVVRRDAWRLATLATAAAGADGTAGLAAALKDDGAAWAKTVSRGLRESAAALDQSQDMAAMKKAIDAIERLPPPPGQAALTGSPDRSGATEGGGTAAPASAGTGN